jgi:hypothetical protein
MAAGRHPSRLFVVAQDSSQLGLTWQPDTTYNSGAETLTGLTIQWAWKGSSSWRTVKVFETRQYICVANRRSDFIRYQKKSGAIFPIT